MYFCGTKIEKINARLNESYSLYFNELTQLYLHNNILEHRMGYHGVFSGTFYAHLMILRQLHPM